MSAVGDIVSAQTSVNAAASLDVKSAGTEQWVIHNIYCGGAAEIYWTDGTHAILLYTLAAAGWVTGIFAHVNATYYLSVKNTTAGALYYGYDGVISRL